MKQQVCEALNRDKAYEFISSSQSPALSGEWTERLSRFGKILTGNLSAGLGRCRAWCRGASLVSRGARFQFEIAIALVSVIPLLALAWLYNGSALSVDISHRTHLGIIGALVTMVLLGYGLLMKYPRTVIRLRRHMEKIASGEIPETVDLPETEDDIRALEECMNLILSQMRQRIHTIEEQSRQLAEAERQKVMTQSLAAACHHLGQPAMTITLGLRLLRMQGVGADPDIDETLGHCSEASDDMNVLLHKLQDLREYRTEPYLESGGTGQFEERILVVE